MTEQKHSHRETKRSRERQVHRKNDDNYYLKQVFGLSYISSRTEAYQVLANSVCFVYFYALDWSDTLRRPYKLTQAVQDSELGSYQEVWNRFTYSLLI